MCTYTFSKCTNVMINIDKTDIFKGCNRNRNRTCRTYFQSSEGCVRSLHAGIACLGESQSRFPSRVVLVQRGAFRDPKKAEVLGFGVRGWGSFVALIPTLILRFFPSNSEIPLRDRAAFAHFIFPRCWAYGGRSDTCGVKQ